MSIIHFRCL